MKITIGKYVIAINNGQTLIEIVIVIGMMALILPALLTGLFASRGGKAQELERTQAIVLAQQTYEAVRSIREKNWTAFAVNGTYYPQISGTSWQLASGTETVNGLTRQVAIADVQRDSLGNIVPSGGTVDPSTKKVTITVSWTQPYASSLTNTFYLTRYLDNLTYVQTLFADFNSNTNTNVQLTTVQDGEVQISPNNKAKWCSPDFSTATIDLPDGPPVAVSAKAYASTSTPNDVFVGVAPYATTSAKLAYVQVTANTDPPTSSLKGTFTLDSSKYSNAAYIPSGINLTNSFKTNDVKYYQSGSGAVYALMATDLADHEVVAVKIKDSSGNDVYQDPTNHIYKYWTYFNTRMYGNAYNVPSANAADTGGDGDGYASNPTRAYASDTSYAVDSNSGNGTSTNCTDSHKDRHRFYNYDFSVPTGTAINGVEVRLDAKVGSGTGSPFICVQLSWDGGLTWTSTKSTSTLTSSTATYTLGGSADTWGRTWSSSDFSNANFRLRVIDVSSDNTRDFSLDWTAVKLYYTGSVSTANDQAPFNYGANQITVLGDTGYVDSGGYLYVFDLSNIDSKSPTSELEQIGCRILLDGYSCQPGNGTDYKYSAGQTGTSWGDTAAPANAATCADGGNVELYADNQLSAVQVGSNKYIYVAVGAATNPEFEIVDVTTPPGTLSSSSCGRGSDTGWKVTASLDFDTASNTQEAANSVYAKSDGTRAYVSSNGGIVTANGIPDSDQFYVIDTSNKALPKFLTSWPSTVLTSPGHYKDTAATGYYNGDATNIQLYPRRALTVLNGDRAVLVGQDGKPADGTNPKDYQVLDLSNESTPTYCGGLDFDSGFNDLTSVSEADGDNFVYMVANTSEKQLKIIQGGPDGTYLESGTTESTTFDPGYNTAYNRYAATVSQPANTSIKFQFGIADAISGSCSGVTFDYTGPDGTNSTYYTATESAILLDDDGAGYENPARCLRYKAFLSTTDYDATPVLYDMTVNYSP